MMLSPLIIDKERKPQQQQAGGNSKRLTLSVMSVIMIVLVLVGSSGLKAFTTFSVTRWKSSIPLQVAPEEELQHVFFNDLKYRRVCSTVYKSILCLIIRYPFEVPLQDPAVIYPMPVDDRFYNITELIMLQEPTWLYCQQSIQDTSINMTNRELIWQCLEKTAPAFPKAAVAMYSRQVDGQTEEDWYGTGSEDQKRRVHEFFDQHVVVVLGDSLARYIYSCTTSLFRHCQLSARNSVRCGTNASSITLPAADNGGGVDPQHGPKANSLNGPKYDISATHADDIWFGFVYYMPLGLDYHFLPVVNGTPSMTDMFRAGGIDAGPSWRSRHMNESSDSSRLRPMTILFEFPLAHSQTHDMIQTSFGQIQYNQEKFTEMMMNITTPAVRAELAELGFSLEHFIVFDGTPQHFPTESGAFPDVRGVTTEAEFLQRQGYSGWRPEYGSTCRGPLTPNSTLKRINQIARQAFGTQGFDTNRWYGKTWEFSNQFWWQESMWRPRFLDCTHPTSPVGGAVCTHKVFLQAMIDGFYEEKEHSK